MPAFNTPFTLLTLRTYVRNYILERLGDVGLVTDTELTDIVNASSRMVWNRIATRYPENFAKRSAANLTVTSTTMAVSYSTVTSNPNQVFKIVDVRVGAVAAAESAMKPIPSFERTRERWVYEMAPAAPAIPSRWYVEGNNLYFTPYASANFDCRVTWVELPQDMSGDSDTLWSGTTPAAFYGDTVAILAAKMALAKDQKTQTGYDAVFQYLDTIIQEQMGPAEQRSPNDPRGI
jgi:hypothetical protein